MSLNQRQFGARIVGFLDEQEVPAHIVKRLMLARTRALEAAARASPAGSNTRALSGKGLVGVFGVLLLVLAVGVWYSKKRSRSDSD